MNPGMTWVFSFSRGGVRYTTEPTLPDDIETDILYWQIKFKILQRNCTETALVFCNRSSWLSYYAVFDAIIKGLLVGLDSICALERSLVVG